MKEGLQASGLGFKVSRYIEYTLGYQVHRYGFGYSVEDSAPKSSPTPKTPERRPHAEACELIACESS